MDNPNQTVQTPPTANTPAQPAPQAPVVPPSTDDSKKMIIWFVVGLIIVAALVGGIYFLLSKRQDAVSSQTATQQPIVQATPKPEDMVSALDQDLSSVNIDASIEADFSSIDQDIQQL